MDLPATRLLRRTMRSAFNALPRDGRLAVYRNFVDCDPAPSDRLVLKIAETREELEACFRLLHDAYVSSGLMQLQPSGMRVTIYHALPTTTTLCAKYDGEVVGTLSLIRESVLGFPLQRIFDLNALREKRGNLAEVSALAIARRFRQTGGSILFPLMKFMYEYCTTFFDTRHLVIAVNPDHIEMYESLLFFQRLSQNVVENYDFVNGAPAVGATLDLGTAPEIFRQHYGSKPPKRNLHAFFTEIRLPNIQLPARRFYTTNDPVLTPELLDYFFNVHAGLQAVERAQEGTAARDLRPARLPCRSAADRARGSRWRRAPAASAFLRPLPGRVVAAPRGWRREPGQPRDRPALALRIPGACADRGPDRCLGRSDRPARAG